MPAVSDGVVQVVRPGSPVEVAQEIVFAVVIPVAAFHSIGCWTDEGADNKPMDEI